MITRIAEIKTPQGDIKFTAKQGEDIELEFWLPDQPLGQGFRKFTLSSDQADVIRDFLTEVRK